MENRPKPVMRRVHVEENKAERTRVVTMSGVLEDETRVWCEEHWSLPTDNALEKVLTHEVWWTRSRDRPSRSYEGALAGSLPEVNHRWTQMDTDTGSAAENEPEARGERLEATDVALNNAENP